MSFTNLKSNPAVGRTALMRAAVMVGAMGVTLAGATPASAQQAIGVPFVGRNHLSASFTELSRNGSDLDRTAVFGAVYGRQLSGDEAGVKLHLILRGAARALGEFEASGIADGAVTLAASRAVTALGGLSLTGAVSAGAVIWSSESKIAGEEDHGRIVARIPLSAGVAYDLRLGGATIAPYMTLHGGYTNARNYVDGARAAGSDGWRTNRSAGVSVRFRETVLSLSEIMREPGMPQRSRLAFTAGMSW